MSHENNDACSNRRSLLDASDASIYVSLEHAVDKRMSHENNDTCSNRRSLLDASDARGYVSLACLLWPTHECGNGNTTREYRVG